MRSRGFTLIEMLVVICLGTILLSLAAGAMNRLERTQRLMIGAGAVNGALQQARAHALKTQKVTCVYFLDGGLWRIAGHNEDGSEITETIEGYLTHTEKMTTPYELLIWEGNNNDSDGSEVARIKLPEGIAWLDAGAVGDTAGYKPKDPLDGSGGDIERNCSLIIKFSPAGNAWAEILNSSGNFVAYDSGNGIRSQQSCEEIRIFSLDVLSKYTSNVSELIILRNGTKLHNRTINKAGTDDGVMSLNSNATWSTVRINYLTGLAELINGQKETARTDYNNDN